jgi:hypothetical protein
MIVSGLSQDPTPVLSRKESRMSRQSIICDANPGFARSFIRVADALTVCTLISGIQGRPSPSMIRSKELGYAQGKYTRARS